MRSLVGMCLCVFGRGEGENAHDLRLVIRGMMMVGGSGPHRGRKGVRGGPSSGPCLMWTMTRRGWLI